MNLTQMGATRLLCTFVHSWPYPRSASVTGLAQTCSRSAVRLGRPHEHMYSAAPAGTAAGDLSDGWFIVSSEFRPLGRPRARLAALDQSDAHT